jgi:hypothetical protein
MTRRNPRRPNGGPDKANNQPRPGLSINERPVEKVLSRLDRVRLKGDGWEARCPGPNHHRGDRNPSLTIDEGPDGRALLYCRSGGCTASEIVRPIGLELRDLFPPCEGRRPRRAVRGPVRISRSVAESLLRRPALVLEVEMATALARIDVRTAQQGLLKVWDRLEVEGADCYFIWQLAGRIRGHALLRFGRASDFTPGGDADGGAYFPASDGFARAVDRMLAREERLP